VGDRDVLATAGGNLAPGLEDGRSRFGRDLDKAHWAGRASLDESLPPRRSQVPDPLRGLPEHGDNVTLTTVFSRRQHGRVKRSAGPIFHLQREQQLGREAMSGEPGVGSDPQSAKASGAPITVEEA
jgi:hypothetical protein